MAFDWGGIMLRRMGMLLGRGGGSLLTYATWNPSDKGASIILSSGNLSVTSSAAGSVRSTVSKISGKWYWESNIIVAGDAIIGGGTSSATLTSYVGSDIFGWGYYGATGTVYSSAALVFVGVVFLAGDVIGFALDADAHTLKFYRNNVLQGTATVSASPMFAMGGNASGSGQVITNFGATPFTYTPPAGYNAGLYV